MDRPLIVILATMAIALVADNIRLRYRNHILKRVAGQAVTDQVVLKQIIQDELTNRPEDADAAKESSDALINFLSTSRELAFEYISSTQIAVKEFVDKVKPHVDYYAKFGGVISSPHDTAMKEIMEAFPKLESLLPDDHNTDTGEV